ncbi:MAG: inositol 2-dehydrogenase [Microbacteriaceae bacterium]|jgi:myo-inositol 2-dehydrogenase / D-chiro-inositol 1-dehydrogenase|nr:inositol 2-dehydrogenase [Microbacteriaceae bacterium]
MATPLRVGLIGTGRIGQVHAMSVVSHPDTTLHRVADVFLEGAQKTAESFGGTATDNPDELFSAGDVDLLIIASPTSTHIDLIEKAIDAGIPALCEKPIDLDITVVDKLRDKANSTSVPIGLGFNRRFDPHFADLRARVKAGDIGALEQLLITSRDPAPAPVDYLAVSGGIFRDMTIHDFDMARYFVPDIVSVTAQGFNQFSSEIKELGDYDATAVALRGSKDELILISNSRHAAHGFDQRLEAFGTEGMLRVENLTDTNVRHYSATQVEARGPYQNFFLERYMDSYRNELEEFLKKIRGEASNTPTFEDGRMALVLANAATESAKSGTTISVSAK